MGQPDPVVEWYRPRLFGRLFLAWLVASSLLAIGVMAIAVALDGSGRVPADLKPVAMAIGVLGTVLGAVGGIFGIVRLVSREDSYLVVRLSGIGVNTGEGEVFIPWSELEGASKEGRHLVLRRTGVPPQRLGVRWQGISAQALALRLTELRRKALLGALRAPPSGR